MKNKISSNFQTAVFNKRQYNKEYNKEAYYYYKSLGICTICHRNEAMIYNILCEECADKASDRYYKRKTLPNYNEFKKMIASNAKKRYWRLREKGLCPWCGKKAEKDRAFCYECIIKNKRRNKKINKIKNPIPRTDRTRYGLCYFCGKPVYKNYKVCDLHYMKLQINLEKGMGKYE
jgi:predicted amidophosphoribosyltransferase